MMSDMTNTSELRAKHGESSSSAADPKPVERLTGALSKLKTMRGRGRKSSARGRDPFELRQNEEPEAKAKGGEKTLGFEVYKQKRGRELSELPQNEQQVPDPEPERVEAKEEAEEVEEVEVIEPAKEPKLVEVYKQKNVMQWWCKDCNKPCMQIREESRCICGHRLKYHDMKGKKKCCKERGCACKGFFYIVAEGSWMLRCQCKHKGIDHDPNTHICKRRNCGCKGFHSPWVCNCDHPWHRHEQIEGTITIKTYKTNTEAGAAAQAAAENVTDFSEINPWQDLKRGLD